MMAPINTVGTSTVHASNAARKAASTISTTEKMRRRRGPFLLHNGSPCTFTLK